MLICEYCGKICKNKSGYTKHIRVCKKNPNRDEKYLPWNTGLTKDNCESIARAAEKFSNRIKNGEIIGAAGRKGELNTSCNLEVKNKISSSMKGNHNNDPSKTGRGKKGWYKGFFCSSTYELAYVIYCLDHNIPISRCSKTYDYTYRGKSHKYYPDFIINNKEIIEIKGFWTELVDIKTKAVNDMPIKVLYYKDLKEIFDYISTTYNKQVDKNLHELYQGQ